MLPVDYENLVYKNGKQCQIVQEELILFGMLAKNVDRGSRVLDIGCGSGEISIKIKDKGYDVTGLDFSPVAVERAKQIGLNCHVGNLDTGICFEDNTFAAVWAGDVIEHVFDPMYVLKEICRILAPGGILLGTIPNDLMLGTRLRILCGQSYQEEVYRRSGRYKHHTFFSIPLLEYMLKQASLQLKETKYIIKLPKIHKRFVSNSRALSSWFADTVIFRALSNKTNNGMAQH
jgi:SAM-dependent methyltransferase